MAEWLDERTDGQRNFSLVSGTTGILLHHLRVGAQGRENVSFSILLGGDQGTYSCYVPGGLVGQVGGSIDVQSKDRFKVALTRLVETFGDVEDCPPFTCCGVSPEDIGTNELDPNSAFLHDGHVHAASCSILIDAACATKKRVAGFFGSQPSFVNPTCRALAKALKQRTKRKATGVAPGEPNRKKLSTMTHDELMEEVRVARRDVKRERRKNEGMDELKQNLLDAQAKLATVEWASEDWRLESDMGEDLLQVHAEIQKEPVLFSIQSEVLDEDKTGVLRQWLSNAVGNICRQQFGNKKSGCRYDAVAIRIMISIYLRSRSTYKWMHQSRLFGFASEATLDRYLKPLRPVPGTAELRSRVSA